ncbi:hypothetical protein BsWGS_03908 [Bradybaena similaris]
MSGTGDEAAAKGTSLHGQGGIKPDPVRSIEPKLKKGGTLQRIDYCYDQEAGDDAKFEFRPAAGKNGHEGVFRVTRSSSSSRCNVLDVSKVIEDAVFNKILLKDQVTAFSCEHLLFIELCFYLLISSSIY